MKRDFDYEKTVKLKHNQVAIKLDVDTGEILMDDKPRRNNLPDTKIRFAPEAFFRKDYVNSWNYLRRKLKPLEFKVAYGLALRAKFNTNSLEPLNDTTSLPELVKELGVSVNKVRPTLNRLFDLGVYAKFEMVKADVGYTKYWVFNPYLSFSGKLIESEIARLFRGTHCEKAFNDPYYNEG